MQEEINKKVILYGISEPLSKIIRQAVSLKEIPFYFLDDAFSSLIVKDLVKNLDEIDFYKNTFLKYKERDDEYKFVLFVGLSYIEISNIMKEIKTNVSDPKNYIFFTLTDENINWKFSYLINETLQDHIWFLEQKEGKRH